jgi:hypothetical protein
MAERRAAPRHHAPHRINQSFLVHSREQTLSTRSTRLFAGYRIGDRPAVASLQKRHSRAFRSRVKPGSGSFLPESRSHRGSEQTFG